MKQLSLCFVGLIICLLQESCIVGKMTGGEPGKCELHGISLHKSLVRVQYGYGGLSIPGGKASGAFPNARHRISGGCVVREPFRFMYNCSECNKARRRYVLSHMGKHGNEVVSKF
jgi:hypothetical protein